MAEEEDLEDFDLDAELDAWLEKQAAEQGIDRKDMRAAELEVIQRFQQNPNPEDFEWLHNQHQGILNRAASQFSVTIPKPAFGSSLLRSYTGALMDYDPTRGANFQSHFRTNWMGRSGRYLTKYTNVGRVPEDHAKWIDLVKRRITEMTEDLGREPTSNELSDDVNVALRDYPNLKDQTMTPKLVNTIRKSLRKDLTAESEGGSAEMAAPSELQRQLTFLHGSLNTEQQLVLEHTVEGFGKPQFGEDDDAIAQATNMSPQKVRAIKGQIQKKVARFYYR